MNRLRFMGFVTVSILASSLALVGCGGLPKPAISDSPFASLYQGSYSRSAGGYELFNGSGPSAPLSPEGGLSISVDKEGEFVGIMGGETIGGKIDNDGRFRATLRSYSLSGKLSHQGIPTLDITDPEGQKQIYMDGIVGNFSLMIDGVAYPGVLRGIGGLKQE